MTAALRLAASLVLSLLMWLPTVPAALTNFEDPARLAGRYLLALLIARIGVGIVFRIIKAYTPPEVEAEDEEPAEEDQQPAAYDTTPFGRRREDAYATPEPTDQELLDEALDDVEDTTALVP